MSSRKKEEKFSILKWGIINLVDDRDLCKFTLKNGNQCGKIARYKSFDFEKEITTCKAHKDKYIPVLSKSTKYKCEKCKEKSDVSIEKLEKGWCTKHEKFAKQCVNKYKCKKLVSQNCTKQPIQTLSVKLYSELDKIKEFRTVNTVLIENQPSLLNPTMKTISSLLYAYFIMRCKIDDKDKYDTNVRFVSPTNKLSINKNVTSKQLKIQKTKDMNMQ